jgi:hypothetical protein
VEREYSLLIGRSRGPVWECVWVWGKLRIGLLHFVRNDGPDFTGVTAGTGAMTMVNMGTGKEGAGLELLQRNMKLCVECFGYTSEKI